MQYGVKLIVALHTQHVTIYMIEAVFARSNTGVMDSNPTRDMIVCVHLFCVCAVLCVGSGLDTG
jgi:hypothetical protein